MKANPDKFQAIAVGKRTKDENITFNLDNNIIHCEDHVKLLGVTIDFKLSFDLHISNVCKKASRQLNVLKRIGRNLCRLGKLNIYYSFIMSNFNYCPLVWHFCGEVNTKKIEKIQERALRFIYQDYNSSYDTLLGKSKAPVTLSRFKPRFTTTHPDLRQMVKSGCIGMRRDGKKEIPASIRCLTMLLRCLQDSSTDPLRLMTAALRFTTVELRMLTMPPRFDTVLVRFKPVALR